MTRYVDNRHCAKASNGSDSPNLYENVELADGHVGYTVDLTKCGTTPHATRNNRVYLYEWTPQSWHCVGRVMSYPPNALHSTAPNTHKFSTRRPAARPTKGNWHIRHLHHLHPSRQCSCQGAGPIPTPTCPMAALQDPAASCCCWGSTPRRAPSRPLMLSLPAADQAHIGTQICSLGQARCIAQRRHFAARSCPV